MAIITNKFKKESIQLILDNFDSAANHYYVGIGRSEDWNATDTAPNPFNTDYEERYFRNSLQSVMKVADTSFVVPRFNWTSNTIYSAYNDKQVGYPQQPYYVINSNNQVFICIQQAKNNAGDAQPSVNEPTNSSGLTFKTPDDYAWKFLYTISALDASKYMAANFLPVKLQGTLSGSPQATDTEQLAIQNAAIAGQIVGYEVVSGGAGYNGTVTLTVNGDGRGAHAIPTFTAGVMTLVEIDDSDGDGTAVRPAFPVGLGYTNATVGISGGTPTTEAVIRPIFGPKNGLGKDPRDDLRSSGIMFNVKPSGAEGSGDFIIGNDFRQVGLIKNPLQSVGGSAFTATTGIALRKITFTGTPAASDTFTVDKTISSTGSGGFKGIVDKVEGATLFYHQTDETGYGTFSDGDTIEEDDGEGTATVASSGLTAGELSSNTGDVLYIDNRAAVTRTADQTEDIKIVIQI